MRKRGSEFDRNDRARRDLARYVLMLLPGFMFLGLFAPAAVSVKPNPEERRYAPDPVSFRDFTPRQAIPAPRAIAKPAAQIAIEPLFTGARYIAGEEPPLRDLPAVAASGVHPDDQIVLAQDDAVAQYVSDAMMFDQSTNGPVLTVDFTPLWDPAKFDKIPGPLSKGGYTQWDDFHGNGIRLIGGATVPIPEPQAGALLALGLLALALRARTANTAC